MFSLSFAFSFQYSTVFFLFLFSTHAPIPPPCTSHPPLLCLINPHPLHAFTTNPPRSRFEFSTPNRRSLYISLPSFTVDSVDFHSVCCNNKSNSFARDLSLSRSVFLAKFHSATGEEERERIARLCYKLQKREARNRN